MKVSQPNPIIDFITSGGNGKLTFVIPVYQRNYSWDKDDCDQLFEDVKNSIPKAGEPEKFHYFGNIVYDESERDPFTGYIQYILIDGQQRITSTMLFLAAIRDEENDDKLKDNIDVTYLKNQDAPEDSKVKLKQIEMDRETYVKIIDRNFENVNKSSAVYKNYDRFRTLIKNAKEKDGITSKDLMLGLRALNVIVIDLQSKLPGAESAQVIFESINATGKPLSDADLLRNYLLFEIGVAKQETYYNDYWLKIEQNIGNSNISDFLRRYLVLRLHRDVKSGTEYRTFKRNYKDFFTDAESAMHELTKYSEFYQWIKQPETLVKIAPKTAALLREADLLRLVPATPTLMWLLEKVQTNEIEFAEFDRILKVIMDWSFRARVTGIISTGEIGEILTTKILDLLENKPENSTSYSDYLKFELSNYRAHDIYATDALFTEAFIKYNFYKNYGRYVQEKLAQESGNDKHIMFESIEHILPQTLDPQKWPNVTVADHAIWVNTIGNLVPMNQSDNSDNSNNGIEEKAKNLTISDWLLTREALNYKTGNDWTIESIKKRGEAMAQKAIKIWSGPLERTRDIEAINKNKQNENMVKLLNIVKNFSLPNIIPYQNQERNLCYFNFHTETMNDLYGINTDNVYCYSIVLEDGIRWDHVNLTLCSHKKDSMTSEALHVQNTIIEMSNNKPKENWQYFKAMRWDNTAEDESDDEEKLREILSEIIPEYERKLKDALKNELK